MKFNINRNKEKGIYDWGINEELSKLINDIEMPLDRRVIFINEDKQYIYDNGQIYQTNAKVWSSEKQITKAEFQDQRGDMMVNYLTKKNDIIIE